MKKNITIYTIIYAVIALTIIFLFSAYYTGIIQKEDISPSQKLIQVFESSGAKGLSKELYFFSKPGEKYNDKNMMDSLVMEVFNSLNTDKSEIIDERIENETGYMVQKNGITRDGDLVNVTGRIIKGNGTAERYVTVEVTGDYRNCGIDEIRESMDAVFKRNKTDYEVNICFTGYFDEKLDKEGLNRVCNTIFKKAKARKVEGINNNNLISISAYSPSIKNYIQANGSKINLNLAIRYNSYEGRTYLWLATPVISRGY